MQSLDLIKSSKFKGLKRLLLLLLLFFFFLVNTVIRYSESFKYKTSKNGSLNAKTGMGK